MSTESEPPRFSQKVVRGRSGRLFLDNDTNLVKAQHSGSLRFSGIQLRQWRFVLENRIAWLARRGIDHCFLVPPNAHSVYPEDLPSGFGDGERRPVLQLMQYLERRGSYARIVYPVEELRRERHRFVYAQTETHWSELGAFIAYRCLAEQITASLPIRSLAEDDLEITEETVVGDLGSKLVPPETSVLVLADVRKPRARLVSDNNVMNKGRLVEFECDDAPRISCLIYGDSFTVRLLPYLAESFGRLVFAHISTLDYELFEREQPDIAVGILCERFIISVPDDVGAPTLDKLAAVKRKIGRMWPPRELEGTRIPG